MYKCASESKIVTVISKNTLDQLQTLSVMSWENAKNKGFHDNDILDTDGWPNTVQLLAWLELLESEYFEYKLESKKAYFGENGKPEGKLYELADVVLRALDTLNCLQLDIKFNKVYLKEFKHKRIEGVFLYLSDTTRDRKADFRERLETAFYCVLDLTFTFAKRLSYNENDFLTAIHQKHSFNTTRPKMHGKKI